MNRERAIKILRNIYLMNIGIDNRIATAARRDMNRLIVGNRPIYSHIHKQKIRIPESDFEPDLLRDTEFIEDKLPQGLRRVYPNE